MTTTAQPINDYNDGSGYWYSLHRDGDAWAFSVHGDDNAVIETRAGFAGRDDAMIAAREAIADPPNGMTAPGLQSMQGMRPMFVPLRRAFFDSFADGTKREEWRRHGARWNADTCRVGRRFVLALGYRGTRRLHGVVTGFRVAPAEGAAATLYGIGTPCAVIEIALGLMRGSQRLIGPSASHCMARD